MNIKEALSFGYVELKNISDSPHLDADVLLCNALNSTKEKLISASSRKLKKDEEQKFLDHIKRRKSGEPVAYITGHKEWCKLDFLVTPDTLIPRPETETLVELILNFSQINDYELPVTILDIGTGSGCIAIALAQHLPQAHVYATDISKKALSIAKQNAIRHSVSDHITYLHGDLLEPFHNNETMKQYDNITIVSNLPYLTPEQVEKNTNLRFEPQEALISGKDGLDCIRKLATQTKKLSHKPENIYLEIDPSQKEAIKKLFPEHKTTFHKDLHGDIRFAIIQSKQL